MKIWEIMDTVELSDEKKQRVVILTKYEIETAIIGELAEFMPKHHEMQQAPEGQAMDMTGM